MILSVDVHADEIAKLARQRERERERRERYESRVKRGRHDANDSRSRGHERDVHYRDYRFIAWDGEAPKDTGYSLFGSSDGHELCHPHLGTIECLDLLLEAAAEDKHAIHVWFGGRYDWDEILRQEVPLRYLSRLKREGVVRWRGYRLQEIPGKVYRVSKDGTSIALFEIHSWFHKRYVEALRDYQVGTPDELEMMDSEKNRRAEFLWSEIAEIREYMQLELRLMPLLMEKIRDICLSAGFNPRSWYGPSALAKELLTRHKVKEHMAECPAEVTMAAQYAFAGGRFEPFRGGIVETVVSTRDRNSAYVYGALDLPSLANGTWRKGRQYEPGKFGVYRIHYHDRSPFDPLRPYPLFRRLPNGTVCWPRRVESWYWSPEAELVANDGSAQFLESWIFDEDDPSVRPFAFVEEEYRKRLLLKRLPDTNPSRHAQMALKWALAAIYGQTARRVGWDKRNMRPPGTHQLEWAGYITSHCRAWAYREAMAAIKDGHKLISIDTDSITVIGELAASPEEGQLLGQVKTDVADGGLFYQSGIYFLKENGEWTSGKSRGVERRRKTPELTPELLMKAIEENRPVQMTNRRRYVTVRMALNGNVETAGQWRESDNPNILHFGGGGKRYHNPLTCKAYCDGSLHGFIPKLYSNNPFDVLSNPHPLPWKGQRKVFDEHDYHDTIWIETRDLEPEEEWIADLA